MKRAISLTLLTLLSFAFWGCEKCRTCSRVVDGEEIPESSSEYCGTDLEMIENKEFQEDNNGTITTTRYRCR